MKGRIEKSLLLVVATVFLFTSIVYAYHGDKKYPKRDSKECRFEKLSEELGLTPEQQAQLEEQREAFKDKRKVLMEKMRAKNKALKEELEKPKVNRDKADKSISDIQALTGEKLRSRVDKIIAMKDILTPEQFEKLQQKMKKKRCESEGKDMHWRRFKR